MPHLQEFFVFGNCKKTNKNAISKVAKRWQSLFPQLPPFKLVLHCFPGPGGMPDIPKFFRCLNTFNNRFGGVILVRPQNHQNFLRFVQNHIFGNHFCKVAGCHKHFGKSQKLRDQFVLNIRPIKCLLKRPRLNRTIGVIFYVAPCPFDLLSSLFFPIVPY